MFTNIGGALSLLFGFLAPSRCHGCGRALWGHERPFLCPGCIDAVRWIGAGACRRCGYPAGKYGSFTGAACPRCAGRRLALDGVAAVARYGAGARELVRSLKFHSERQLAAPMGTLMAERWLAAGLWRERGEAGRVDMVVPVALHPRRRRERGFDQSALLAETIAERLGAEFGEHALSRVKATRPQALLRRKQRLKTMDGVFAATDAVKGKTVLLADDVFTTGATMSAAAAACKRAGAKKVYGVAFTR